MAKRKTPQAGVRGRKADPSQADETTLNENQQHFCREYARHGNGTLAYHHAYPNAGYSTCRNNAARLLADACIQDMIAVHREARQQELNITREDLLRVFAEIAFNPFHKQRREAAHDLWEKLGFTNVKNTRDRSAFLDGLHELSKKLGRPGET